MPAEISGAAAEPPETVELVMGAADWHALGCEPEDADKYVEYHFKPNFKLNGPRLGPLVQKLKEIGAW